MIRQQPEVRMMPGKRIQFDNETLNTLNSLASDSMMDFQELADEAFRDLLRKHNRPVDLKDALRKSVREGQSLPEKNKPRKKNVRRARKAA
jgi:hypothetical protein